MAKPALYDIETLKAAGLNYEEIIPKRRLASAEENCRLLDDMIRQVGKIDQTDAINRYRWYNLPDGLDSELMERVLYFRGQGMFFYDQISEKFMFLPYALDGEIDVYGRFLGVTPLPMGSTTVTDESGKPIPWIKDYKKKPRYEFLIEQTWENYTNDCVLIHDSSIGLSQLNTPRFALNKSLVELEATMLPFLRTALLNSTGVQGMRVPDQDCLPDVLAASNGLNKAALNGQKWVGIVGSIDFQELTGGNVTKAEDFLMSMQAIDNLRLETMGLSNGGLFEKKAHVLQSESDMNNSTTGIALQDGLKQRQRACDLINSVWSLGVSCELSESAQMVDRNGDGMVIDEEDQSGTNEGEQNNMNPDGGEQL